MSDKEEKDKDQPETKPPKPEPSSDDKPSTKEEKKDDDLKAKLDTLLAENEELKKQQKENSEKFEKFQKGLKILSGDEDDKLTDEEKIEALALNNEQAQWKNMILETCVDKGITTKEHRDYFEYLLRKEAGHLDEGQDMPEKVLDDIVNKVKSLKTDNDPPKEGANSSTNKNNPPPQPDKHKDVTLEQFRKMNLIERSELYRKDKPAYEKLYQQFKGFLKKPENSIYRRKLKP